MTASAVTPLITVPTRSLPERIAGRLPTELGSNCSASAATIPARSSAASSSGERPLRGLEREVERDRLPPLADLLASVDVEHANVAQHRARRLPRRVDERADLDVLVDRHRDVLAHDRVGDHVLVLDRIA